jgi:hypothetical protein
MMETSFGCVIQHAYVDTTISLAEAKYPSRAGSNSKILRHIVIVNASNNRNANDKVKSI